MGIKNTDYSEVLAENMVHLSRLSLAGRRQDILLFVRRMAGILKSENPKASSKLISLLKDIPTNASPLRGDLSPIPVDRDSRLQLIRVEDPVVLDVNPIWHSKLANDLNQVVKEISQIEALMAVGLEPTRSLIFTGLPGVGKTLAARWLAKEVNKPLLVLDLSAVMSSFLGRTGTNVRFVLDYAKSLSCVLLLDEFDAIAKRRDDSVEVGELKRLVTVLLQEIDDWPSSGLLVAATNHPDLIDPAIWRRFDQRIDFPMPGREEMSATIGDLLKPSGIDKNWTQTLATVFAGSSFSDVNRMIARAKREAVLSGVPIQTTLMKTVSERVEGMRVSDRIALAVHLVDCGFSQREAHRITGVSRDTIRKVKTAD